MIKQELMGPSCTAFVIGVSFVGRLRFEPVVNSTWIIPGASSAKSSQPASDHSLSRDEQRNAIR
jgi:hypothetical protein